MLRGLKIVQTKDQTKKIHLLVNNFLLKKKSINSVLFFMDF